MAGMADFNRTDRTRMGQREGGTHSFSDRSSKSSEGPSTDQKLAAAKMGLDLYKGASGSDGTDSATGIAGGAMSGAMMGSAIAPGVGTAVGAVAGGVMGGMQASAAKKAKKAQAESEHFNRLASIEEGKAQRLQNAIAGMAAGMGAALRR